MVPKCARVSVGLTLPVPGLQYANVKPEVSLEATVQKGETLEEVEAELEAKVLSIVTGLARRGIGMALREFSNKEV